MTKPNSGKSRASGVTPKCPYCDVQAVLGDGARIKKRGMYWFCANFPRCDAFVPCHKDTEHPVGTLANRVLRTRRWSVIDRIDMCWRNSNGAIQRQAMDDLVCALMRRKNFRPSFASMRDIDAFELAWPLAERVAKEWMVQGALVTLRAGVHGSGKSMAHEEAESGSASEVQ